MKRFTWVLLLLCTPALEAIAQTDSPGVARFQALAERIVDQRLNGLEEDEKLQQQALDILEAFIARRGSGPTGFDIKALNEALAPFVAQHPSVGEGYQVVALPPAGFALVANFSFGGPAAIRLYEMPQRNAPAGRASATLALRPAARIDRFVAPGFFDENVDVAALKPTGEAAPASQAGASREALFLTVSGRTDDLQTGAFAVWRWRESGMERVWESELLQQSSYEAAGEGLSLTFCAEPDDARPRICRRMVREKYAWREGAWKRLEQSSLPVAKP